MRATLRLDSAALDVDLVLRPDGTYLAVVDGDSFDIKVTGTGNKRIARLAGTNLPIELRDGRLFVDGSETAWAVLSVQRAGATGVGGSQAAARIRPPMAGKLDTVRVKAGQPVQVGDVLFVLEAMKMQNDVRSPVAGIVSAVHGEAGQAVEANRVIVDIEPY
ncbi:MAG: biotin/lipoyl-containing protein [bacterium]